jgi:hypothetical protein
MTRTEARLADALAAVGRSVREETLPPLPARGRSPAPRRWGRWLAPLAAAASVTLIVILISAVHPFSGAPGSGRTAPLPHFYVTEESTGIQVRDTATGVVTAKIPDPFGQGVPGSFADAVAAGAGGREFVAEYTGVLPRGDVVQTRLYSFRLTGAGRVAGLAPVKGGRLAGFIASTTLAVSPDGSQAAAVVYHTVGRHSPPPAPQIVVINLRTGARSYWAGGLQRTGLYLGIPSITWGPGGSLTFLAQWCQAKVVSEICGPGRHAAQVRTLSLAAGGPLSAGRVLLSESPRYPFIVQALLSPGGRALTIAVLHGPGTAHAVPRGLQVVRLPVAGGPPRLLYSGVLGPRPAVFLGSDASGRHLLLAGRLNGWIGHGRLHPLPPRNGSTVTEAW